MAYDYPVTFAGCYDFVVPADLKGLWPRKIILTKVPVVQGVPEPVEFHAVSVDEHLSTAFDTTSYWGSMGDTLFFGLQNDTLSLGFRGLVTGQTAVGSISILRVQSRVVVAGQAQARIHSCRAAEVSKRGVKSKG